MESCAAKRYAFIVVVKIYTRIFFEVAVGDGAERPCIGRIYSCYRQHCVKYATAWPMLQEFIASSNSEKCFIVLHTYGSHFNYRERYPENFRQFLPDDSDNASRHNREKLINAYDNSIVATDALIDETITTLEQLPDSVSAAMLFVPDHGEDIFDDGRDRFLHASPSPTYWQIHVPIGR